MEDISLIVSNVPEIHQIRILFELTQLYQMTVREYNVDLDISDSIYLLFSSQKENFFKR